MWEVYIDRVRIRERDWFDWEPRACHNSGVDALASLTNIGLPLLPYGSLDQVNSEDGVNYSILGEDEMRSIRPQLRLSFRRSIPSLSSLRSLSEGETNSLRYHWRTRSTRYFLGSQHLAV